MSLFRFLLFSIGKKSIAAPFPPKRFVTQKMRFHSSSYLKSPKPLLEQTGHRSQTRPASSKWKSYLITTTVLGGIGSGLLYLHLNDEKRAIRKGQCTNDGCGSRNGPVIGGPFRLIDTNGRLVTEEDLSGDWILLHFGYTSSPDVGPAELAKLAKAVTTLTSPDSKQSMKIRPVFVTLDPQRDTPSHLRAYLKEFDERIMGLTGPVGSIKEMAHAYRVFFKKVEEDGDDYLVESSHNMYLINPNSQIVRTFGVEYNAEQLSEEIRKELNKTKV
ncbi:protein SCO1 homolog 2, mitochondrial-like [Rutidosis leptorrhynchoides]|uniref:protein SCO1 homolog 2, mitochondrial-like n=1 Tax=Rutidosis leptorrhynchoides TaxID=125765 RepID=UPI003A99671A